MKKHILALSLAAAIALAGGCAPKTPAPKGEGPASGINAPEPLPPLPEHAPFPNDDKAAFAEAANAFMAEAEALGAVVSPDAEELSRMLEKATFAADKGERSECYSELESRGVFLYDYMEESRYPGDGGRGDDFSFRMPVIAYNAWDNTWTVTCGGSWNNDNWNTQSMSGKIGSPDSFGVVFNGASEGFVAPVASCARFTDQNGETATEEIRSPETDDGYIPAALEKSGDFGPGMHFTLQDRKEGKSFVGYRWYGSKTYAADFADQEITVTSYYIHTDDDSEGRAVFAGFDKKI